MENIDTLNDFLNNKLKDFEKSPSKKSLRKIQSELHKDERTPVTFWLETFGLMLLISLVLYWMSTIIGK